MQGVQYSSGYPDWQAACAASSGYDDPAILEKTVQAAREVKAGRAVYERDSVLFGEVQYSWPVLAGMLFAAARARGRLSVLDYGGALGTAYVQSSKFLSGLDVAWSVVEQAHVAAAGRAEFEQGPLRFFDDVSQAIGHSSPNVILLGGVLQFMEKPTQLLEELADIPHDMLIVDRTPFTKESADVVCVQHVPPGICSSSYPFHAFSWDSFHSMARTLGWELVESFDALEGQQESVSGLRLDFRGCIFARRLQ